MITIWKWLDGHKSAIGATLNALLMWTIIKGFLDEGTATLFGTILTIWTGIAVGHHMSKGKGTGTVAKILVVALLAGSTIGCGRKTTKISTDAPIVKQEAPESVQQPREEKPIGVWPKEEIKRVVLFAFDSDDISESEMTTVQELIPACEGRDVCVKGGACPIGTEEYNFDLGMRRAAAVSRLLAPVARSVRTESVGESNLITTAQKDYHLNRRAEVRIK